MVCKQGWRPLEGAPSSLLLSSAASTWQRCVDGLHMHSTRLAAGCVLRPAVKAAHYWLDIPGGMHSSFYRSQTGIQTFRQQAVEVPALGLQSLHI